MAGKRKVAKGAGSKRNGESIFQVTPIIIKGGDSIHFQSDLIDFEDDDGKKVPHVQIKNRGRIGEVSIRGGIKSVVGDGSAAKPYDITLDSARAIIVITFLRES